MDTGRQETIVRVVPRLILVGALACALSATVFAQQLAKPKSQAAPGEAAPTATEVNPEPTGAPVEIDGRNILVVYAPVGGFSTEERADHIRGRILAIAKANDLPVSVIHAEDRGPWEEILAGENLIMGVTEYDARIAGHPRALLASEDAEVIRQAVTRYRQEHTWHNVLRGLMYFVISTVALVLILFILFRIYRAMRARLDKWSQLPESEEELKSVSARALRYIGRGSFEICRAFGVLVLLTLLQFYVMLILGFFPATRSTSGRISEWVLSAMANLGRHFLDYLPNMFVVGLICLIAYYLIRLNHYVFGEIRDGRLKVQGFYPEWADPTAKIVHVIIVAATAIVVFPYVPGSSSPAFQGITVFLGILLSLGSSSAVAHAIAGIILTYMRSFHVGDFVRFGEHVGEIVEKTILATRIRTQKREIVTIPSGSVLGGIVVNYSAEARKRGIILHTRVTIGYNAPWKKVHELLIAAALATEDILPAPPPFVLQASLDDFYVSYELNAFTSAPQKMQILYSELHQNIQDKFNVAGIEINSPHYASLRDGNRVALPEEYLPSNYKAPSFNVEEIAESANGKP